MSDEPPASYWDDDKGLDITCDICGDGFPSDALLEICESCGRMVCQKNRLDCDKCGVFYCDLCEHLFDELDRCTECSEIDDRDGYE